MSVSNRIDVSRKVKDQTRLALIARKSIAIDTELTWDYGMSVDSIGQQ